MYSEPVHIITPYLPKFRFNPPSIFRSIKQYALRLEAQSLSVENLYILQNSIPFLKACFLGQNLITIKSPTSNYIIFICTKFHENTSTNTIFARDIHNYIKNPTLDFLNTWYTNATHTSGSVLKLDKHGTKFIITFLEIF